MHSEHNETRHEEPVSGAASADTYATTHGYDEPYGDSDYEFEDDEIPTIGSAGAHMTSFMGFVLMGVGGALAAAPYYSWQVQAVARQLTGLGIETGVVFATGLVLFLLGRQGRVLSKLSVRRPERNAEVVEAVGTLAQQVSFLAETVANMQENVTHIGLREPVVNVEAPSADEDLVQLYNDQKDAVFRLAASLDKLGKCVTEQVASEIGTLDHQFESVRTAIASTRSELEGRMAHMDELATSTRQAMESLRMGAPAPLPVATAPAAPAAPVAHVAPVATAPQPVPPAPVHMPPVQEEIVLEEPHPQLQADVSPLSFLDGLKEMAPASQNPHAPSVEAPPLDFDVLDQASVAHVDEPPAALPGQHDPTRERNRTH